MSWEAGEEAEDGFVGAPGVVSHQTASQPESPVLRFLPVGFAVQVKQEVLWRAAGTWHIAGPARGLVNVSTPSPVLHPLWDTAERPGFPVSGLPCSSGPVFLSCGCYMESLPVLEARVLASRCQEGHTPSRDSRENPFLPPPASVAAGLPWLVVTSL